MPLPNYFFKDEEDFCSVIHILVGLVFFTDDNIFLCSHDKCINEVLQKVTEKSTDGVESPLF